MRCSASKMDPSSTTASSESSLFSGLEIEMVGLQAMKRIPLIKFPRRHPKPSASGSSSQTQAAARDGDGQQIFISRLDVPAAPTNTAVGGKASLQPKRTPVTDKEIEAVLLGGNF